MAIVNTKKVLIGALAGWVAWVVWSALINMVMLAGRYAEAQEAGTLLTDGRYPFFLPVYFLALLGISYILAWMYAGMRDTYGANPSTAIKLGLLAGFAISFPCNFSIAAWSPLSRVFPLWWMLEMWIGAVIATFIAAWLYKED
jgi:hypothetical protein